MALSGEWLSVREFADLAGIVRRSATAALAKGSWRGHALEVRQVGGRGGRSGFCYQVSLRSLSEAIDRLPSEPFEPARTPVWRATANRQDATKRRRYAAIEAALDHPFRSPGRAAAVAAAALRTGKDERTLYRWLAQYEASGLSGLGRAKPSNAGQGRVVVSRPFDRAFRSAGYDDELLNKVGASVEGSLKGLWASRAELAGWNDIRRSAEHLLLECCEKLGIALPEAALRLSRRHVERFAHYRVVNQRRNDRKAFDDHKPRIRRDWRDLAPMERIVADVKHLDVIVTRADGSPTWPKIVGFMDAGTGRTFAYPVLLDRGEGVRQEHVTEAFLAMVSHPHWGFPQGLYLDNGSEFAGLEKIDGALQLLNEPGARTIIYAKPYNASAKPIESLFARHDRYIYSQLPGYAGGNRMAAKTQTVGRPPKPYPHPWEHFCETVAALVEDFNNRPVGSLWGNRSPNSWLQSKADEGWRPVAVNPLALDAAFCNRDSRRVHQGTIRIGGERYTHPALSALPSRTVVDLALPWRRGATPLFHIPGGSWAYLEIDRAFPAASMEGARETSRRQRALTRHVSALEADAPSIDPVEVKVRRASRHPVPALTRLPVVLDTGAQLQSIADARPQAEREKAEALTGAEAARRRREVQNKRWAEQRIAKNAFA